MLWLRAAHGARSRHAGAARRPRAGAPRGGRRRSATPMCAGTTRRRCASGSTRISAQAPGRRGGSSQRRAACTAGQPARRSRPGPRPAFSPIRWCGARGRGARRRASATPCCSACCCCTRRSPRSGWRSLGETHFRRPEARGAGRGARPPSWPNRRASAPPSCRPRSAAAGHGEAVAAILEKLRRAGLGWLADGGRRARCRGLGRRCPLASSGRDVIYRASGSRRGARARVRAMSI